MPARNQTPDAAGAPTTATRPVGSGAESIAAVDRALDVLLLLGASGRENVGVTEISAELGLSKAAAHRILTSLRSRAFVAVDPRTRRYHLGPAALGLGRAYLARIDLRALAATELAWIAAQADESAALSVRAGAGRMYVDQAGPDREVRTEVVLGRPLPLRSGAPGKAFLAFLPTDEMESLLRAEVARGETSPGPSAAELARVRAAGVAIAAGDDSGGIASIAAPVLDHDGMPTAVISVCGPAERVLGGTDRISALLLEAAHRLSARVGGPGTAAPAPVPRS